MLRRIQQSLTKFDWPMLIAVFALFSFGLAAIYSVELSRTAADFAFLRRQITIALFSCVIALFVFRLHVSEWRNIGRAVYLLGIIALIGVLFFGTTVRGTTGWYVIFGFSFQPVEFMKLGLAVELARYFSERARVTIGLKEIVVSGLLTAVPVLLVGLQPDLGSASILMGMWFMMLVFAGINWKQMLMGAGAATAVGAFAWLFLLYDYQKERVAVFLNPDLDPLGAGYNVTQAKIAIGSGQLFGRGLGFGSQSQLRFLPESQTDFVFAVLSEELGFIGTLLILSAISVLLWRIARTAYRSRDAFSGYFAAAIFSVFFVQMFINIGVNLTIFPATGVALPFISYGGSSLLISIIFVAILQSIVSNHRPGDVTNSDSLIYSK